jgi:hypothetical protein
MYCILQISRTLTYLDVRSNDFTDRGLRVLISSLVLGSGTFVDNLYPYLQHVLIYPLQTTFSTLSCISSLLIIITYPQTS